MDETPHEKKHDTIFTVGGGLCAAPYWRFWAFSRNGT